MQRTDLNPWAWQEKFAYSQGIDVQTPERIVVLAGQGPMDADGELVCDDMPGQVRATMANIAAVLAEAGMTLADVVKLTIYTTDVDAYFEAYGEYAAPLAAAHVTPAATLIGVTRLAVPGMQVEIEATAIQ